MDFCLVAWLLTAKEEKEERVQSGLNRIEEAGPESRLPSVIMRKADEEIFRELEAVLKEYTEKKSIVEAYKEQVHCFQAGNLTTSF